MSAVTFASRWLIEATLVLRSPLVIRTGESKERPTREDEDHEGGSVAQIERDVRGRPYIPGTGLKGAIRAWALRRLGTREATRIETIFGHQPRPDGQGHDQAGGGRAEFHDAFVAEVTAQDQEDRDLPDADDGDAVTAPSPDLPQVGSTTIDRRTGSAERQKLRFTELVPKGERFRLVVTGDGLEEQEVGLLLQALNAFGSGAITLGADGGTGKGRTRVDDVSVRRVEATDVVTWLQAKAPGHWRQWARQLSPLQPDPSWNLALEDDLPELQVRLELAFDGPFLVGEKGAKEEGPDSPDLVPTTAGYGEVPVLPGESVKGALRAQAERIVRTVHGLDPAAEHESIVERLFGPGAQGNALHRGALEVSDFLPCHDPQVDQQEFVAIDRFTGGAASGAKFSIRHLESPRMAGTLTLRLCAPRHSEASGKRSGDIEPERLDLRAQDLGLLALLLRDVAEGDVTFGHGATKGYGACRIGCVRVESVTCETELQQLLPEAAHVSLGTLPKGEVTHPQAALTPFREAIRHCIACFIEPPSARDPGHAPG